jgi:hypothetical protein
LAGYDDRNETDRVAMRIAEQQALKILDNISIRNHFHINYCLL